MLSPEAPPARPLILADRGCPYAHRVLALLEHLGVERDLVEAAPGQLPLGLERWSPSGRIPLLVHGRVVLGESRVMLEHLAEAYGFGAAYAPALEVRSLQRQAMALLDGAFAPRLIREDPPLDPARLAECLDLFEAVTSRTLLAPSLFAFHFAPLWLRFQWWRPRSPITLAFRARPTLAAWLDGAAHLDAVARTGANSPEMEQEFRAVCALHGAVD